MNSSREVGPLPKRLSSSQVPLMASHISTVSAVRTAREVENLPALDVHARHEDGVGPGELALLHGADVLVDELDLPFPGHERRDEEDPLGRHEGLDGPHQGKGTIEGAEGLRVSGKDAKDTPDIRRAECPYVDRRNEEHSRC